MVDAMHTKIRLVIADDRLSSRRGLRALFGVEPQIQVIGEAADGQEAIRLVEELKPDVVLMDISMPGLNGLEATRLIKGQWPEVKVVVLTMFAVPKDDVLRAGADSFLIKGCPTKDLVGAICEVMSDSDSDEPTSPRREREENHPRGLKGHAGLLPAAYSV
jgi:two-component system response regulator NreC